ncbi:dual specificity protein phosphatase 26 isoform X2 [Podarcis raffonei]|uniref:dual specificity protein phosphatase 26 isoform X2 n=1 Tax=Podarcis raffonei TaxID=65483 RepID=UPI0023295D8D|nr:dual specificity protein phosphatase 26 isoform X2 [Podarcis raffonei]
MAFLSRFSRNGSRAPSRRIHDDTVSHPILSVFELERLLYTGKTACNHADEVWPGLYLGDQDIAANRRELARLNITHILNASHSKWRGGADYYEGTGICYLGIEAHDSPTFDMSPYFDPAADFIHKALSRTGAQKWKASEVLSKEDWQLKLMNYVQLADLTYRIREQEEHTFKEDWKMFIKYMENNCVQLKMLAALR